jgi:putative ABC transport system permease protein
MNLVAIKMLLGDVAKYLGLIFGIAFATLLMAQQTSLFIGIMARTYGIITETVSADIWVMDPKVQYIDGIEPMPEMALAKVRGVEGVSFAAKMHKGNAQVKVGGRLQMVTLVGVDDVSFVGAPQKMLLGKLEDLNIKNAVIIDQLGYNYVWPNEEMQINRHFEANDKRMLLVGVCDSTPSFSSPVLMYSRYQEAITYTGNARNKLSFILVKARDGVNKEELARRISKETNLKALTWQEFRDATFNYYITHTGIAINFGITVALGFIVGAVISGQTFYIFVVENLRQFAALKAIGIRNPKIVKMVLTQAALVSAIGYSIGIGLTSLFFAKVSGGASSLKGFFLPAEVAIGVAFAVAVIIFLASLISIRKVLVLDPATVFRA